MLNSSKYAGLIACAILVLVMASSVEAKIDTLEVAITSGGYYFNHDSTQARCILNFPVPEQIRGKELIFAEMFIPISFDTSIQPAVDLFCYPLLTEIGPGHFPETDSIPRNLIAQQGVHFVTSTPGQQEAYFDVTQLIESWRNREIENHGLLLFTGEENRSILRFVPIDEQTIARLVIFSKH